MKNRKFLLLALLPFIISSCDLFDDVGDVNFNTQLTTSINVSVSPASAALSAVVLIDATNDSEVQLYADKIKGFKISNITYKVTNYDGPSPCQLSNASMRFSESASTPGSLVATIASQNIAAAVNQENTLDATSILTQIESFLTSSKKVYVHVAGEVDPTPVDFTLEITMDVTVTANPLK